MGYYIYQNHPTKKIRIHIVECSFCSNGNGLQKNTRNEENGKWYGSFKNYEEAIKNATNLANKWLPKDYKISDCGICLKTKINLK